MQNEQKKKQVFTEKGMTNVAGFSATLQRIHNRLMAEGYKIVDGKIVPPVGILYNKNNKPHANRRAV